MTQTQRSLADIVTLLATNGAEGIDATDLRDTLETIRPGHAELSVSTPAATVIAVQNTYVKAAGTTVLSAENDNWSMPADNQLQYNGVADRVCFVSGAASMTTAGNNIIVGIRVALNGTTVARSEVTRKTGTGSDRGAASFQLFGRISPGDQVEVHVAAVPASDITLETLNLSVVDFAV